jgi:magnesium-transporting ATPase (P-type)
MFKQTILYRFLVSLLCTLLGLAPVSVMIFRQSNYVDFWDVVLRVYLFFFIGFFIAVFLTGELLRWEGTREINKRMRTKTLFRVSLVALGILLIVPIYKVINDDVVLATIMIASYLLSMVLYLKLVKAPSIL